MSKFGHRLGKVPVTGQKRHVGYNSCLVGFSPWKVLLYHETLIGRMVELSKRAFESFTSDQLVCGIVLTRAVLEVSAALWFLCAKVEAVVDSKVVGDVDEYLMKLAMGNATGWPENSAPG
jgi:hypothetical protein